MANSTTPVPVNSRVPAAELQAVPEVVLGETSETLRPTHGVPAFEQPTAESSPGAESATKLQALVLDLTPVVRRRRQA